MKKSIPMFLLAALAVLFLLPSLDLGGLQGQIAGQKGPEPSLRIDISGQDDPQDVSIAIQLVVAMTLLTLSPSLVMMMTSFTRIVIVLSFVRMAMGVQQAPSNQIVVGLALFLTFFIMSPTWDLVYRDAVVPYMEEELLSGQALEVATGHMKTFMLKQTDIKDVDFMLGLSQLGPMEVEQVPLSVIVPSFVLSELRTAFQMGFLIYMPFIIVDFIVATSLMSMGMMMMPPVIISMPFKILLFVVVDGWNLVISSLVKSFRP
jgi:flagellar biosynthetic protein FliP